MAHLLGYARVSTTDQQPQLQIDALERAGCYQVFTETAAAPPPIALSWSRCRTSCAPAAPLVMWKLDRLGRSRATWSTPSPASPTAALAFAACRRRSTPPPRPPSSRAGPLVIHGQFLDTKLHHPALGAQQRHRQRWRGTEAISSCARRVA